MRLLYAVLLSDKEDRIEAERCWLRAGYKKGASGEYEGWETAADALLSSCNRGGIVELAMAKIPLPSTLLET